MNICIHREGGYGDGILEAACMRAIVDTLHPEEFHLYGNGKAKQFAYGHGETKQRGFGISINLKAYDLIFDARPVPFCEGRLQPELYPMSEEHNAAYEAYHRHKPEEVVRWFESWGGIGQTEAWTRCFGMPCTMRNVTVRMEGEVPTGRNYICLGAALGEKTSSTKTLSKERWETIVEGLPNELFRHLGDHAERKVRGAIDCTMYSMEHQMKILSGAKLYVGGDGLLAHVASALGIPSVVCWGPTPWQIWGHRDQHRVVSPRAECLWWTRPRWYETYFDKCVDIMGAISAQSVIDKILSVGKLAYENKTGHTA